MTTTHDVIKVIEVLAQELKKYHNHPTKEAGKQLHEWIAEYWDNLQERIHSFIDQSFVSRHESKVEFWLPTSTRKEREAARMSSQQKAALQEQKEAKESGELAGLEKWKVELHQIKRDLKILLHKSLDEFQNYLLLPEVYDIILPTCCVFEHIQYTLEDLEVIRQNADFVRDYKTLFMPYVIHILGIALNQQTGNYHITHSPRFKKFVTSDESRLLLKRLLYSSAIFAPEVNKKLQASVRTYFKKHHNQLLEEISLVEYYDLFPIPYVPPA